MVKVVLRRPAGFPCPKCGGRVHRTIRTTHKADLSAIRRVKECVHCGHRFTTIERAK